MVADALLHCIEELPEEARAEQNYLHGLLLASQATPSITLPEILARFLPRWNRQASDFPRYLEHAFGADALREVLDQTDRGTQDESVHEKTRCMRCATGQTVLP